MTKNSRRLFFALRLQEPQQQTLYQWGKHHLAAYGRHVHAENLHITLLYLGELSDQLLPSLCQQAAQIKAGPFQLEIDQLTFKPRSHILWLGAQQLPQQLEQLVSQLQAMAERLGLEYDKRIYRPHITLLRRAKKPIGLELTPIFKFPFNDFVLFESVQEAHGVSYIELAIWPLAEK
jgi:2'-5' RNA ligase